MQTQRRLHVSHHEWPDVLSEAVVLSPGVEALWAPALGLLPAVVHGLQAARQVGALGDVLAADLVVCCHPPRHNWYYRVLAQRLLQQRTPCSHMRPACLVHLPAGQHVSQGMKARRAFWCTLSVCSCLASQQPHVYIPQLGQDQQQGSKTI